MIKILVTSLALWRGARAVLFFSLFHKYLLAIYDI